jgi:hypothetical protein
VGHGVCKDICLLNDTGTGETLIETRLPVHGRTGWQAFPYVWDQKQKDATLQLVPDAVPVAWTDSAARRHNSAK